MVELSHAGAISNVDEPTWVDLARRDGALVFADVGWDPTGAWSPTCSTSSSTATRFMPNAVEAMAYTRTDTPHDALYALADRVPLAVVTNGRARCAGHRHATGEEAQVPALRVREPSTRPGPVTSSARRAPRHPGRAGRCVERLSFAALCSGLALQQFGGSLAAPGWGDLADWHSGLRTRSADDSYTQSLRRRYAFLGDLIREVPDQACRRATATDRPTGRRPRTRLTGIRVTS